MVYPRPREDCVFYIIRIIRSYEKTRLLTSLIIRRLDQGKPSILEQ